MDLVFMSTFNDQSMSIGCVGKLGHLSGFLRHYLLILEDSPPNFQFRICGFGFEPPRFLKGSDLDLI